MIRDHQRSLSYLSKCRRFWLFVAATALLIAPILGNIPTVSAQSDLHISMSGMHHVTDMPAVVSQSHNDTPDCSDYCARSVGANLGQNNQNDRQEKQTPEPDKLVDPLYFVQHLYPSSDKNIRPARAYCSRAIEPPDIITVLATYRI